MNQQEFYKRVAGILAPERLQKLKVVVVGLGSGGCRVAAELGRLGLRLVLLERPGERLEEHNIVRHLLGYRSLGRPKLSEMIRYIHNLNPLTQVTACALDVADQRERLAQNLGRWRPDLVAVCTDNEPSKHAINQAALPLGIPQVGAGVYDGGIGGEVYRVRPGGACYGCIAAQLHLQRRAPQPRATPDYNRLQAQEVPSTCALNLDIEQIALLQTRLALDLLLGDGPQFLGLPPAVNLCVFANRIVPGTFVRPLHCDFFSVARDERCLECGRPGNDLEAQAERILSNLGAAPKLEPIGSREGEGCLR